MNERPPRCVRVQRQLPALIGSELGRARRRLVERHLRRCDSCATEAQQQREVVAQLAAIAGAVDASVDAAPPPDLLESLLAQANDAGLRERIAAPARGAVSGARPGLSVALVAAVLAAVAAAAYAGWRVGQRGRHRACAHRVAQRQ
jgi:anti-sigma factor RsiW